jgi:hypothetical protein
VLASDGWRLKYSPAHSARQQALSESRNLVLRPILWLLVVLGALAFASPTLFSPSSQPVITGFSWRRTLGGWERIPHWRAPDVQELPHIHPVAIATLQLALSLLALSSTPASVSESH